MLVTEWQSFYIVRFYVALSRRSVQNMHVTLTENKTTKDSFSKQLLEINVISQSLSYDASYL